MNEIIFSFRENKIRIVEVNGEPWFIAKDVCEILGLKNPTATLLRVSECNKRKINIGRAGLANFVNKGGLKQIVVGSKSHLALELARELGIEMQTSMVITKEQETIEIISKAFSHLRQHRQFFVDGYRVDLYFPDEMIAVECDEFGHQLNKRLYTNDIKRQIYIQNKLKCKFIRYNPDDGDFNIGTVINQIMMEVYNGERVAKSI